MNLHQRLFNFILRAAVALAAVFGLPAVADDLHQAADSTAALPGSSRCRTICEQRLSVQLLN